MPATLEQRMNPLTKHLQSLRAYLSSTPWPLLAFPAALGLAFSAAAGVFMICEQNEMFISFTQNAIIVYCFVGLTASQSAAICMWWAWSRSEFLWRTLIIVSLVFISLAVDVLMRVSSGDWVVLIDSQTLVSANYISFGLSAACIPLWIMRKLYGWGILSTISEEGHDFTRQISIRDIMVATAIVAVLAGLARQSTVLSYNSIAKVLPYLGLVGIFSTITLPLLTYLMLHEKMRRTGISWALGLSAMIPFVPLIIISLMLSGLGGPLPIYFFMFFEFWYAYCGSVILMLYVCRRAGFRLITAWDKLPADEIVIRSTQENKINESEITLVDE
jgi:hypothetical protein